MKWLLLLVLVSCGKHEQPKSVDLNDYDGDLKVGETGFDKYSAEFEELGLIEGSIRFFSGESFNVNFSNQYDPNHHASRLIVGDMNYAGRSEHFFEGSKLKLDFKKQPVVTSEQIEINLIFSKFWRNSSDLLIINGKSERNLGTWDEFMKLIVSKNELLALANGEAYFKVLKKNEKEKSYHQDSIENIQEKTYKIVFSDGKNTKVYYISKDFSYDQFLVHFKIKKVTPVDDELLFFDGRAMSGTQWFERKYENGDIVLVKSTLHELKQKFMDKFNTQKLVLKRENGSPVNSMIIKNTHNRKMFLRVRAKASSRSFVKAERRENFRMNIMGGSINNRCLYHSRLVKNEQISTPELEAFLNQLDLSAVTDLKFREQQDEKGIFWEIMLYTDADALELKFASKTEDTFVMTGDYKRKCSMQERGPRNPRPQVKMNKEGFFHLDIESFVERAE